MTEETNKNVEAVRDFLEKHHQLVLGNAPTFYAYYLQNARKIFEHKMGKSVKEEQLADFEAVSYIQTYDKTGQILIAEDKKDNGIYILKEQHKKSNDRLGRWRFVEESMTRLHLLRNSFIVHTISLIRDDQFLYQKQDYALYGDLERNFWRMHERADRLKQFKLITAQVVLALEYLKSVGIVHNDLRMANILLFKDGHIRLTGFVYSHLFEKVIRPVRQGMTHLAPEIIMSSTNTCAGDWWSLGVLIYRMLLPRPQFKKVGEKTETAFKNIMKGEIDPTGGLKDESLSKDGADIIKKLIVVKPGDRLGGRGKYAEEVRRHPWFKGVNFFMIHYAMYQPEDVLLLKDAIMMRGEPVIRGEEAEPPPKPEEGAGPAKPPPKPEEGAGPAKPPPKPEEGAGTAKPTPKPEERAETAEPPPKPEEGAGPAKPPPKPEERAETAEPPPKPEEGAKTVEPPAQPKEGAGTTKPLPKPEGEAEAAKPADEPKTATQSL